MMAGKKAKKNKINLCTVKFTPYRIYCYGICNGENNFDNMWQFYENIFNIPNALYYMYH